MTPWDTPSMTVTKSTAQPTTIYAYKVVCMQTCDKQTRNALLFYGHPHLTLFHLCPLSEAVFVNIGTSCQYHYFST